MLFPAKRQIGEGEQVLSIEAGRVRSSKDLVDDRRGEEVGANHPGHIGFVDVVTPSHFCDRDAISYDFPPPFRP